MADYLRPDVYVEEHNTGEKPIQGTSTSVGALIGVTPRGKVNEPIHITSWSDFTRKFALGLDTPFLRGSDLPNAVYGFFQNGGASCYIVRPKATDMAKATATSSDDSCTIEALDEGAWANKLVVSVTGVADSGFDITVKYNGVTVEQFEGVTNNPEDDNYYDFVVNEQSAYFRIPEGETLVQSEYAFAGGLYDASKVTDAFISEALDSLDAVMINIIAVPGKTTDAIHSALVGYADKRGDCFAIVDLPKELVDPTAIQEAKEKIGGNNGAVYHPWGKIADPLSKNNILKACPPSGHIMGTYARTDSERGVHKAPAGETVQVRGFADLTVKFKPAEVSLLNPKGVNCIIAKPNKGIIVWGARSLHSDPSKRYVSDVRYDLKVKNSVYEGTQWAVFEPNGPDLWSKINTSISAFLNTEWINGALQGETAEQAYYVKCDAELNTEQTMNQGLVIAEIGYAKKKPAEFVVVRIVQKSTGE